MTAPGGGFRFNFPLGFAVAVSAVSGACNYSKNPDVEDRFYRTIREQIARPQRRLFICIVRLFYGGAQP